MSETKDNWEDSGLLVDLSEDHKEVLSHILENAAHFFMGKDEVIKDFETWTFPVIRRVFDQQVQEGVDPEAIKEKIDFEDVYESMIEFFDKYERPENFYSNIDIEPEIMTEFSRQYKINLSDD